MLPRLHLLVRHVEAALFLVAGLGLVEKIVLTAGSGGLGLDAAPYYPGASAAASAGCAGLRAGNGVAHAWCHKGLLAGFVAWGAVQTHLIHAVDAMAGVIKGATAAAKLGSSESGMRTTSSASDVSTAVPSEISPTTSVDEACARAAIQPVL